MALFKKKIDKNVLVQIINKTIIDDGKIFFERAIKVLKEYETEKNNIPERITDEIINNFIIFIFFKEIRCLTNLFPKKLSEELKELSIKDLVKQLDIKKEELVSILSIYENKFDEDIKAGINPFDSIGIPK